MIGWKSPAHVYGCVFKRAFSGSAISLRAFCMCYECLIALVMGINWDENMGGHDFVSD